jgi:hypothetical protein
VTRRLKLTAQLITLACVAGLLALLVWKLSHQQHAPRVGAVAPAFTLRRLDGPGKVSLDSYWTSYQRRGVVFLGVDYHDLASDARRFVDAHSLTFPMLRDGSGRVTGRYGIDQVPETYVLNRQGRVVAHLAGPITDPGFASKFHSALVKAAA